MWLDKSASLTPSAYAILINKATELPNSGAFNDSSSRGSYLCRRCGLALFRADSKFISACGWPSFDDEILDTVRKLPDADGRRIEILCSRCDGHLGHIFHGEGLTAKNQRYCVNSASIDFVTSLSVVDSQEAIVAGGCFWGVEHLFKQLHGVLLAEVGYCGGEMANPNYEQVCRGNTGHVEAVRVVFDAEIITYHEVIKYFFEIHNPLQNDGQGPDLGSQYLSKIFVYDDEQLNCAKMLIADLLRQGMAAATSIMPMSVFWAAEEYHQAYYTKNSKAPYCHVYTRRFD